MKIEKVMMVDDDASIRKVAEVTLQRVGKWEVAMADSGVSALALVNEFKPDVILLDVMMPGMDGPTTFKKFKDASGDFDTPVIFMTAKVQRQEMESYSKLGAAGVISKPFNPMTLPDEIRSLVDRINRT
ncbi:MAG: response regulator [Candidatus Obscuribacter sp.]|nr:response regulator [Candidatus Obscuribacter sp.]